MGFDKSLYNKFNFDREYEFISDYTEVAGRKNYLVFALLQF